MKPSAMLLKPVRGARKSGRPAKPANPVIVLSDDDVSDIEKESLPDPSSSGSSARSPSNAKSATPAALLQPAPSRRIEAQPRDRYMRAETSTSVDTQSTEPASKRSKIDKGKAREVSPQPPQQQPAKRQLADRRRLQSLPPDIPDDSDESDGEVVSTRSRTGHAGSYNWEAEPFRLMTVDDLRLRMARKKKFIVTIDRDGKVYKNEFRRGNKIWILPDPEWLPSSTHDINQADLPDDLWWIAEITDCCILHPERRGSEPAGQPVGFLKVKWLYTPDQVLDLDNVHPDYKARIRKYRFDHGERIASDHFDFLDREAFAGFVDEDIPLHIKITGLAVDDADRIATPNRRQKCKSYVRLTGFTLKEKGN